MPHYGPKDPPTAKEPAARQQDCSPAREGAGAWKPSTSAGKLQRKEALRANQSPPPIARPAGPARAGAQGQPPDHQDSRRATISEGIH